MRLKIGLLLLFIVNLIILFLVEGKLLSILDGVLLAVLGYIIFWAFIKEVNNKFKLLEEFTSKWRQGRYSKVSYYNDKELGKIVDNINHLIEQLEKYNRAITEGEKRLNAILAGIKAGVMVLDREGRVILVNKGLENLFGKLNFTGEPKPLLEVIRNYELEKFLKEALANLKEMTREIEFLLPNSKTILIHVTPLKDEHDQKVGLVAVFDDITEERKLEKMRSEFIANVSHELRTPLTSIKGFLETLLDGALEDKTIAKHFLQIMNSETERLTRLIDDLLSLSKIEAKKVDFAPKPLMLQELVQKMKLLFKSRLEEKELSFIISLPENLPLVLADGDMISQVLINLIDNAIKYTPAGGKIEVSADVKGSWVEVVVKDTGIGIPEESQKRIFERFYRVDKARSRELGGTGLGLAIVKHIIELHNGKVWVKSKVGEGSAFGFTVPIAQQAQKGE
ncbi:PAS domain-containing sensor histidine kinase [Carboxydothermus islandicus]|uniref:histidine kinase n=1 Tax=Carboxydothermus islandicus TaxID=661089 RepID=A0A1L8D3P9_9THEO|nr:ATP-binding protein [Carboxydothermus islandicus]GAV25727.1 PAS domain-containing sensor histidine kinase [Carboxydothermus islandicus]